MAECDGLKVIYSSPMGRLLLSCDGEKLTGIGIIDEKNQFSPENEASFTAKNPVLISAIKWLDEYFCGNNPPPVNIPMKASGTDFQLIVWDLVKEIPYGTTCTYGEIAEKVQKVTGRVKPSAQAVGGAVGKNPLCIIVPCHRVIGSKGRLTGYRYSLDIKSRLLEHEKAK